MVVYGVLGRYFQRLSDTIKKGDVIRSHPLSLRGINPNTPLLSATIKNRVSEAVKKGLPVIIPNP